MTKMDLDRMIRDNRRISIQMECYANRVLASLGITAAQAHVLLYVLRCGGEGTSLTAIHRAFGYSMAHLSATLKSLREKGCLRVESCAQDDRRKIIFVTGKGEELGGVLERDIQRIQKQLYVCFSREELTDLDRLQQKMLKNLSALIQEGQREVTKREKCTASAGPV